MTQQNSASRAFPPEAAMDAWRALRDDPVLSSMPVGPARTSHIRTIITEIAEEYGTTVEAIGDRLAQMMS